MKHEIALLGELRKWVDHASPLVRHGVLQQLTGVPERAMIPALIRLLDAGLANHELRVPHVGGAWCATDRRVIDCRECGPFDVRNAVRVHKNGRTRLECYDCERLYPWSKARWPDDGSVALAEEPKTIVWADGDRGPR